MAAATPKQDWILRAAPGGHVERIEAYFGGHGYDMHRHDTYAIGRTLSGVQSFNYRRDYRHSLPGGTIVLHPDEPHDGQAGTDAGFHYRMIYVEPALIQQILGGRPLGRYAATAGFTDQSHLTHRHVQTYGMTPDRWRRMLHA